jgi:hypothetical protein
VYEAAADARERGLRGFDFLGQDGEWKLNWTRDVIQHVELRIYHRSLRGRLRHAYQEHVRPRVGQALRAVRERRR